MRAVEAGGQVLCHKCQEIKDISAFPKRGDGRKRNYRTNCKDCNRVYFANYWDRRGGRTPYYRQRSYNITPEQYESMKKAQNGACAICDLVPDVLHVDHDHATGKVRSLLCGTCNTGIGLMKENTNILQRAAEYLKMHASGV